MFDEIGKRLDGDTSDEVTLLNARESLEFVYCSFTILHEKEKISFFQ